MFCLPYSINYLVVISPLASLINVVCCFFDSPDPSTDKPPSYEEVMAGSYPPTVSATILDTIPEALTSMPSSGEPLPNYTSVPPYPSNTLQAQTLGWSVGADPHPSNTPQAQTIGWSVGVEPYPSSADTQSFQQTGSGTNYTWGAASYPSQQVTGSSVPQQDTVGVSVAAGTTPQTVLDESPPAEQPASQVQVVNEYPSVSIQHHTVLSTPRADDSSTLTATTIPPEPAMPSADTLPTVQVETFNELPLSSSMNSQTELPLLDQAMHGCNRTSLDTSNALATHVKVESSLLEGEEEGDVGGELDGDEIGTRDEPSSTNSALPPVSSPLPVMAQSEC